MSNVDLKFHAFLISAPDGREHFYTPTNSSHKDNTWYQIHIYRLQRHSGYFIERENLSLLVTETIFRSKQIHRNNRIRLHRNRRQRTDIGKKNSFVNRTIRLWNRLPAEILRTLPCKPSGFRKRVRKVINVVN
jgi:hypothetical protein